MKKQDWDNMDVAITGKRWHHCCVCNRKFCDCKEREECWLCSKCRRIAVDRLAFDFDPKGFTLLSGAPDTEK